MRRLPPLLLLLLACALLPAVPAAAQPAPGLDDKIFGVETTFFDLPDSGAEVNITPFEAAWRGGILRDVYRFEHEGGGALVTFRIQQDTTLKDALQALDLSTLVKDLKPAGKPRTARVNDMPAASLAGTGRCGESPCTWRVHLYETRPQTVVFAVAFINDDKLDRLPEAEAFIKAVDLSDEERQARNIPRKKVKEKR